MGDKPSKSSQPPAEGGMSRGINDKSRSTPILVEDDNERVDDHVPLINPKPASNEPSAAELKKRQTKITKDIMLRNGNFGPAEANLLAKMFMEYFSETDNYLQAYQRFHREIRVFSIHGDARQKRMAQLLLEIHTDEVKRYGNIAYGNGSTGASSRL